MPDRDWLKNLPELTDEEKDARASEKALLQIINHAGIRDGADLTALVEMMTKGKTERTRLRAAQALLRARLKASDDLSDLRGDREANLAARGLSKNSTTLEVTHKLQDIPLDALKRLAGSSSAPTVIDVEITSEPRQGVPSGIPAIDAQPPSGANPPSAPTPSSEGTTDPRND